MKKLITLISIIIIALSANIANAQWQPTGPWASCLASDGTNIVAGYQGSTTFFLSTTNGSTWTQKNTGSNGGVVALAISGTNIFVGTGNGYGAYVSTNNGSSWTKLSLGNVQAFAISGTKIFAGTGNGVFLSTNNGSSWTSKSIGLLAASVHAFAINGTNIFAGTGFGVFLSTNNGSSWTSTGLMNLNVRVLAISGSGTAIFAGTTNGAGVSSVFLSTNNGNNWTAVNNGNGLPGKTFGISLAISGTNIFVGTDNGVYLSTNNGSSWTSTGFPSGNVSSLVISGTNIFAGTYNNTGSGLWKRPLSDFVTGIEDKSDNTHFMVYPNPTSGKFTLVIATQNEVKWKQSQIEIYNTLGEKVYQSETQSSQTVIDISNHPSGVYFLNIKTETELFSQKIVIQK